MREVQVAVAKSHKYASRESGDTVEVVERPHGGLSIFLVDAQGSGLPAKTISNLLVSRGVSLIKEGTRDGAVARSLHDYLFTLRQGRVSATLAIISVDLQTQTLVLSRNDECPAYFYSPVGMEVHDEAAAPLGIYPGTKPIIVEKPLADHLGVVVMSDGIVHAGERRGAPLDGRAFLEERLACGWPPAQELADALLERALELEDGRPRDDASVVVVTIVPIEDSDVPIRRLAARLPIESRS